MMCCVDRFCNVKVFSAADAVAESVLIEMSVVTGQNPFENFSRNKMLFHAKKHGHLF